MAVEVPDPVRLRAEAGGQRGLRWIQSLPEVIADLERAWGIAVGATILGGTAAYVAEATTGDGEPAVVKVAIDEGVDGTDAFDRSTTALTLAEGRGCVRLLAQHDGHSAMLLERLGRNLVDLGYTEEEQLVAICTALRELWRPVGTPVSLPTGAEKARWLADTIQRHWDDLDHPCSERAVEVVLGFAEQRAAAFDPETAVLVHGDAHGWNTVTAPGGHKLVDPEGLISNPAHDLAVPMREMSDELLAGDAVALGLRRARRLSELTGADAEAIWQWGSIERVSTGLYCLVLGHEEWGRTSLAVADRWALRSE